MPFKFNPITGNLDLVNAAGSGGGITGPISSTDKAITRWDGTTGTIVDNSKALVQDGGAVVAQGHITNKIITDEVVIDSDHVMMTTAFSVELTGEVVIEADGEMAVI